MTDLSHISQERFVLNCRGRTLDCRPGMPGGAQVMGILNVTPDSFSDGGEYTNAEDAVKHAGRMLDEGASVIDVGGESSRPAGDAYGEGAEAVPEDEELRRVLPVVRGISETYPEAIISIDTYKASVAEQALDAGAHIVNDITALREDPGIADVCAHFGAPLILMHSSGRPGEMVHVQSSDNIVSVVRGDLQVAVQKAQQAGVDQIVLDPGFGFGKTPQENLTLLAASGELQQERWPVLVGISRKSTIGNMLGIDDAPAPIMERLFGSLGATAAAVLRGATIVRTHDVQPTVEMLKLFSTTLSMRDGDPVPFTSSRHQFNH